METSGSITDEMGQFQRRLIQPRPGSSTEDLITVLISIFESRPYCFFTRSKQVYLASTVPVPGLGAGDMAVILTEIPDLVEVSSDLRWGETSLHVSAPEGSRFTGDAKCMRVTNQEQPCFPPNSVFSPLFTHIHPHVPQSACSPGFAITSALSSL